MAKESYTTSSVIRGHHVYKEIWTPYTSEELATETEDDNSFDQHAVALLKNGDTVGHMPRHLAQFSWYFIKRGGEIKAVVTGKRQKGVGLEVPCNYIFIGSQRMIKKLKRLLATSS